jgi:hypothetical protein
VIGDTPYGQRQIDQFPGDVAEINADPAVSRVIHLGDIKNGSSRCDTSYFRLIRVDFDGFADPLVYTPGDNEWTDCHRANDGGYQPAGPTPAGVEPARLETLRSLFFDHPGSTLGRPAAVEAQAAPFVENVSWSLAGSVFATLNVPGSNNDLAPWFGDAETEAQRAAQRDEYESRLAADLAWIDRVFARAHRDRAAGVVIGLQADMWDPEAIAADAVSGYAPIVKRLAQRTHAFHRPVLLLEGDSHLFKVDNPLADPDGEGSRLYAIDVPVPNLTRIVVQGSTNTPHEWLRLRVDPATSAVFSWENVVFGG